MKTNQSCLRKIEGNNLSYNPLEFDMIAMNIDCNLILQEHSASMMYLNSIDFHLSYFIEVNEFQKTKRAIGIE